MGCTVSGQQNIPWQDVCVGGGVGVLFHGGGTLCWGSTTLQSIQCAAWLFLTTHTPQNDRQPKTVLITQLFLSPSSVWSRRCTVHRNAPVSCWTSCYARWCSSHPLPHQSVFSCCTSPASQSWRQWLHVLVIMNNENKNNKEIFKSANL